MATNKMTAEGSAEFRFCPACEKESALAQVSETREVEVRGESYSVKACFWRCRFCSEEFEGQGTDDYPAEAYRLYRQKHGMMQPEEIREARRQYGLTQAELAEILGFGPVTLSRYETGMLQSESHDRMLHCVRNPRNFLGMFGKFDPSKTLPPSRLEEIKSQAQKVVLETEALEPELAAWFNYGPSCESGNSAFAFRRFINCVLFYCVEPDWKTKINKFLFYADFNAYRQYGRSITGARYARATFGPCPDRFERLFSLMSDMGRIGIEEVSKPEFSGEIIHSLIKPNLGLFAEEELTVLEAVRKRLRKMSAKRASDLSHKERGYRETKDGQIISYSFAKDLRLTVNIKRMSRA